MSHASILTLAVRDSENERFPIARDYCTLLLFLFIRQHSNNNIATMTTIATTTTGHQVLLKELADLLGFEDGAEDVLGHLLTIESSEVSLF